MLGPFCLEEWYLRWSVTEIWEINSGIHCYFQIKLTNISQKEEKYIKMCLCKQVTVKLRKITVAVCYRNSKCTEV